MKAVGAGKSNRRLFFMHTVIQMKYVSKLTDAWRIRELVKERRKDM